MRHVLLDTHAWAWSLTQDARLSQRAVTAMQQAETVFISTISLFEIGQKVRLGKWPEMAPFTEALPNILEHQGGWAAELSPEIAMKAAMMDWSHRDPFDRIIAATALTKSLTLISADAAFDALSENPRWKARIW